MGIWIDTDMGFDDLLAILLVHDRGEEVDGISLVFGNTVLERVARNAAGAAAAFGWAAPIHLGRASAVLGTAETAERILGRTGIRSIGREFPDLPLAPTPSAFEALAAWLAGDEPHRILALGPLTNIAALALARPDLAARITELMWLGGAVTAGNHTASAEFNAVADPEAVAIVLAAGLPLKMVDLDIGRQVVAWPDDVAAVRAAGGRNAPLLADFLAGFVEIAVSRGRPAMALYDAAAAVAFLTEDIVRFQSARIDMELAGTHTRGRTVVDHRPQAQHNAEVAVSVDADAARAMVLEALLREAGR